MDVHPPHHSIMNWRDFWIHLGTITIGLLIAIGLEQSVEKLHHLHERHQLEADLRAEGERDLAVSNEDVRIIGVLRAYKLARRTAVAQMCETGGHYVVTAGPDADPDHPGSKLPSAAMPSDAVWASARESQMVALLPRQQAEVYARLYRQHDTLLRDVADWVHQVGQVKAFENRYDPTAGAGVADLSRMLPADCREYENLLTSEITALDTVVGQLKNFRNADRAMLEGSDSEEDMLRRMDEDKAAGR